MIKKTSLYIAIIATIFIGVNTLDNKKTNAATIYSQPSFNNIVATTSSIGFTSNFTTTDTATVGSIRVIMDATGSGMVSGDTTQAQIKLVDAATLGQSGANYYYCYHNLSTQEKADMLTKQIIITTGSLTYLTSTTGNCNLKSGVEYRLSIFFGNGSSGKTVHSYGLTSSSAYFELSSDTTFNGVLADLSNPTYFVTPYSPANGAIQTSANTTFSFDYYYNDVATPYYNAIELNITDVNNGAQLQLLLVKA